MADLTAHFGADFTKFSEGIASAETRLTGFQGNAAKVQSALDRMVSNFSGVKVVQEASLMASALGRMEEQGIKPTQDALDLAGKKAQEAAAKLRALGQEVPADIQKLADSVKNTSGVLSSFKNTVVEVAGALGIAFGATAALQFGKNFVSGLVESAGALVDLNVKTGVSIEQLQRFAFVGKQAGVSVEDFAQASFKLGANLAGGSGSVKDAVEKLGLSYEQIIKLNPEDQFNAVTAALEKMTAPQERNRLGIELFGKSFATIAPAVAQGYTDMAKQAQVSSAAQIKAIDDANDAFDRFIANIKARATSFLGTQILLNSALKQMTEDQKRFYLETTGSSDAFNAAVVAHGSAVDVSLPKQKALTDATADYSKKLAEANAQLSALTPAQRQNINDALKIGESHEKIANAVHVSTEAIALYVDRQRAATTSATEFQRAVENLYPLLKSGVWDGTAESLLRLGGSVDDVATYMGIWKGQVKDLKSDLDDENTAIDRLNDAMKEQAKDLEDATKAISKGGGLHQTLLNLAVAMGDVQLSSKNINTVVGLMPDLTDAAARHMAELTDTTKDFDRQLNNLSYSFSLVARSSSGAFSSIASGASNAIGGFADLAKARDDFASAGGFFGKLTSGAGIVSSAISIGSAIFSALKNIGGPSKDELAARDTFANFQKQYGSLQQTIDAVGAAYAKAGRTGVQAQQDLKRALDATHISAQAEADALAVINGVLDSAKKDQDDLNAAVQRYGFSIQELGPAMQKQQLDEQAKQLLNDWRLLVASGIDLSTVNEHMAGSINDYLKLARATGQEVPEAMKGILQKLIDTGELTDDAGNKITDLQDTGVTFATTMTEGFQSVVDKLSELIAKIPDLASAFSNIPAINVPVNYVYNTPTAPDFGSNVIPFPGASTGGLVTPTGIAHFSSGTDSVPAMLTPGEMVLTDTQRKALLSGGGGGAVIVNITVQGSIRSDKEVVDMVTKRINETLGRRRRAS